MFARLFGASRYSITHADANLVQLEAIPNDADFIREGAGTTEIGSVGHGVNLRVEGNSSVKIRGNIGSGCKIYKDGPGTLIIEGRVTDDLKLTVYGQGSVTFTHYPSAGVIAAIKHSGGAAQIICAGAVLPPPNQGYARHNLGRPAEPRARDFLPVPAAARPQPAYQVAAAAAAVVDQYSEITKSYIEVYKQQHHKSIAARINELGLTEDEKPLFEGFADPITMDYIEDVPVAHNEKYYNLSTLENIYYRGKRQDPLTREPLRLVDIQPARKLLEDLDKAIIALKSKRAEAAKKVEEEEQPGLRL